MFAVYQLNGVQPIAKGKIEVRMAGILRYHLLPPVQIQGVKKPFATFIFEQLLLGNRRIEGIGIYYMKVASTRAVVLHFQEGGNFEQFLVELVIRWHYCQ
jgi:hypothetical protein